MRKRVIEKDRFQVRDEKGRVYEIIYFIEQIDVTTLDDTTRQWEDGMGRLQLSTGGAVNMISDSEYDLVSLGGIRATRF